MLYIQHRVNTIKELCGVPTDLGVEIDLRDCGNRVIVRHDPFGDGEDFDNYLKDYRHRFLILNIKSERIEERVLESVRRAGVKDYFFLDCSFPMVRRLISLGESQIAMRFSEYEPVEGVLALAGQVQWVWCDCFTRMPLTPSTFECLKAHFKLCIVSPELHGRPVDTIAPFAKLLADYPVDAICTKRSDLWVQSGFAR